MKAALRRARDRRAALMLAVVVGGWLAGCGQRGPLVLPPAQARPEAPKAPPGNEPPGRDQRRPAM